jgi:6-phosphofructokinase 1
LALACVDYIAEQVNQSEPRSACIGQQHGIIEFTDLEDVSRLMDRAYRRPKKQWWLGLRPVARVLAQPGPEGTTTKSIEVEE